MTLNLFFACHFVDRRPNITIISYNILSTSPDFRVFFSTMKIAFTIEEQESKRTHYPESIDDNSIIQKKDIHATKDTLKCSGMMLNVMH